MAKKKYSLVGQDGNAFSLMGYTARAMRAEGMGDRVSEMREKATAGDYYHLIAVCDSYLEEANKHAEEKN